MIVGLTGGIACGKSTVASLLAELGAQIADADEVARSIVRPGQPALEEIAARFGAAVLNSDGTLNRRELGAVVFSDPAARRDLEAILHPRIFAELAARLAGMDPGRPRVVEAALLVETLPEARRVLGLDVLMVVTCPQEIQRDRLAAQGMTAEEADRRIRAQIPAAERVRPADYVIYNDADIEHLRRQVDRLWRELTDDAPESG